MKLHGKRFLFVLLFTLTFTCCMAGSQASAALRTGWQKQGGHRYYYSQDGVMKTGLQRINGKTYYFGKDGKLKTGWQSIKGKKYYFDRKTGRMYTKRHKIGKHVYYFNKKGVLQVSKWVRDGKKVYYCGKKGVIQQNRIVVTKKGRFYVDGGGVRVTAPEIMHAVDFVAEHTKDSWSADVKLKHCFDVLWQNYPYKRYYETPSAQAMPGYANDMFVNGQGNCYRYAASFACIAKVLGFDARVASGLIIARSGGMTPHGFTEINVGGVWYICDANMQRNHPERNSYMCTEGTYPYVHTSTVRFTLVIKGGKVVWV